MVKVFHFVDKLFQLVGNQFPLSCSLYFLLFSIGVGGGGGRERGFRVMPQ